MTAAMSEVPFTDLLRSPVPTTRMLESARAVRLRRRDDEDLVLMLADRADDEAGLVELSVRLLAALWRDKSVGPGVVRRVMPDVLPWTRFLPDADADEFIEQFIATTEAASALNNLAAVTQLLLEWRHTAEIYGDPHLYKELTRPLADDADFGPVPRPETPESED